MMAISKQTFDEDDTPNSLREKVLEFLDAHPDQAFTLMEVAEGIGLVSPQKPETMNTLYGVMILFAMSMTNRVRDKVINGDIYYMIKSNDGSHQEPIAGFV